MNFFHQYKRPIYLFLFFFVFPLACTSLVLVAYYQNYFNVSLYTVQVNTCRVQPTLTEPKEVTLLAVGDIMLSRNVGTKMFKANDYTLPFSKTSELLFGADITIGNLESPFYNVGPRMTQGMVFKAEPQAILGLQQAGFDFLALANNHMTNQGLKGLNYTIDYLNKNNILAAGAGADFTQAHQGAIIEREGMKFGFLSYSYADLNDEPGQDYVVAGLNIEQAQKDISEIKKQVDVVIVLMHAGEEYTVSPNIQQKNFAHGVIEAGADLVIGSHPHWAETIEDYHGKWIFYSLGNFVFDQEWSRGTKEGLILEGVWRDKKLYQLQLLPVIIENYSTPRLATLPEKEEILKKINLDDGVIFQDQNLTSLNQ